MSTRKVNYTIESDDHSQEIYVEEDDDDYDVDEGLLPPTTVYLNVFKCDMCDSEFATKDERNAHIEDHFKSYECPNCLRSFVGDRAFEYHTRSGKCKLVVTPTLFRCKLCAEKVFQSEAKLKQHQHYVHGCAIDTNRITCEQCQRTFGQLRYLRKHIHEVHRKLSQFDCSECGKVFNRKSNLLEHMLIHEQKYLASCNICKKLYRTKSALRLHVRTHTGDKPYQCDICKDKRYAYNTDLNRHRRSAHGILGTPHPCPDCHKVFYEPKFLRRHCSKHHPKEEE